MPPLLKSKRRPSAGFPLGGSLQGLSHRALQPASRPQPSSSSVALQCLLGAVSPPLVTQWDQRVSPCSAGHIPQNDKNFSIFFFFLSVFLFPLFVHLFAWANMKQTNNKIMKWKKKACIVCLLLHSWQRPRLQCERLKAAFFTLYDKQK